MNQHSHVHRLTKTSLGLSLAAALAFPLAAQADGAFKLPTGDAANWGRAGAGGSLYPNDATAAYNNPAAMAFFTGPVAEGSLIGIRPYSQFKGDVRDSTGNPVSGNNPNGFGKTKPFGNAAFVYPVNERLALGLGFSVPYGLAGDYGSGWKGRYFGTATNLRSEALTLSAGFKVNDEFSIGLGLIGQYTRAQLTSTIDTAGLINSLGVPGLSQPPQSLDTQLGVHVKKKLSFGWVTGFVWKPTSQDTFGFDYHSGVRNDLSGKYKIYAGAEAKSILALANGPLGAALNLPPISPDGGDANARVDMPAFAHLDWVHFFNDRFSLAADVNWTNWNDFQDLALVSNGHQLVALPEKYKDSWSYSIGGEYRVTEAWTLRGGLAYDETPTNDETRDPRIPDGSRKIVAVGVGYKPNAHMQFDLGYQHQFVSDAPIHLTNPRVLGGSTINGSAEVHGDVISLTSIYRF